MRHTSRGDDCALSVGPHWDGTVLAVADRELDPMTAAERLLK